MRCHNPLKRGGKRGERSERKRSNRRNFSRWIGGTTHWGTWGASLARNGTFAPISTSSRTSAILESMRQAGRGEGAEQADRRSRPDRRRHLPAEREAAGRDQRKLS